MIIRVCELSIQQETLLRQGKAITIPFCLGWFKAVKWYMHDFGYEMVSLQEIEY